MHRLTGRAPRDGAPPVVVQFPAKVPEPRSPAHRNTRGIADYAHLIRDRIGAAPWVLMLSAIRSCRPG